jgi:hypothetical protein
LDSANPFTFKDLVSWTHSDYITAGANKQNVMGIKFIGDKLTVYANGHQIAEVTDDKFDAGRYGVYVSPENTVNYTYRVVKMSTDFSHQICLRHRFLRSSCGAHATAFLNLLYKF